MIILMWVHCCHLGHTQLLEHILSVPYCSDLVASQDGSVIGWVSNEKGIRSIYTAQMPDFQPKERFKSVGDDGQILRNIQFGPNNEFLYCVRGSAANRQGEIANPNSSVQYPRNQLLRIDIKTGQMDTLGAYNAYVIDPGGGSLLIPQGKKLIHFDLKTNQPSDLLEVRGTVEDVVFAPDGHSICFVSNRGDHSFIGHFRFGEQNIQWLSPSVYRDQMPVWSANGNQVAFIRAPGRRRGELLNITGGHPFSIVIHDLDDAEAQEIWTSPKDDGGFAQYYPSHPLRWAKDGPIIFYSEHEGWMKIYTLDPETGKTNVVQKGNCEIEHSHLSLDGKTLIFSSNCGDIDRRNLFLFDIAAQELTQLTHGDEIETNPIWLSAGTIAYRHATYDRFPAVNLIRNTTSDRIFPEDWSEAFTSFSFVKPKQVIFKSEDGSQIHGQLFIKDTMGNKPGLLFMHGGPIRQMLLGQHYSSYYANAYTLNQYLAHLGYAVMSVNYRAGIGYGRAFRRAEGQGPRGATEYQDIVAAGEYLQNLSYVDQDRIGLWGGSYGGYLTAMGLAKDSELFKAGVDFHGVHDWSWRATDFSNGGAWGITEDLMEEAFQSSPNAHISSWTSPVLLIHGDDDRNVMFGQTIDLVERLKEQNVHTEVLVLPDEVHGFYRFVSWLQTFEASVNFFDRFLMSKP